MSWLVSRALGYLAASRHGLAEDELMDLLSRDPVLYRWFLLGGYHLPGDLLGSAGAYPLRPAGQEPEAWLPSVVEAARIWREQPWRIHRLLGAGRGRTVTQLAEQAGVHPARAQRILTGLAADGLAAADEEGRWTAMEPGGAGGCRRASDGGWHGPGPTAPPAGPLRRHRVAVPRARTPPRGEVGEGDDPAA